MGEDKEGIMPVLKFSYYHLSPSLKSCFSYCALFPKDHEIYKEFLINLWMAQGCLDGGLQDGRSIEDVGEEYFSILLQRCFLQDTEKDMYDEIYMCKMHDLIHDLAQEVAGKEFSLNSIPMDRKFRHLNTEYKILALLCQHNGSLDEMNYLRTILISIAFRPISPPDISKILAHGRCLRVLKLCWLDIKVLSNSLSNLVHLRYLDLSDSDNLEMLPKSITKLLNLQVMKLSWCSDLKELPSDLGKLVNLRQLDTIGCSSLTHMPAGLDNLTCLHTLTMFVLGRGSSNQVQVGRLQELKHLVKLKGQLDIVVREGYSYDATNAERGSLVNKSHVKNFTIEGSQQNIHEGLLEVLEPHCNVTSIRIVGFNCTKFPDWAATMGSSLPLLVRLSLVLFPRLQNLPLLSQLQHLKFLSLDSMDSVEYMEDDNNDVPFYQQEASTSANLTFFPSLETLEMRDLPKLKGWWREDVLLSMERCGQDYFIPSFPRLRYLDIINCPNMTTSFPGCPHLKEVLLRRSPHFKFCGKKPETARGSQIAYDGASSSSSSNDHLGDYDLERLTIDDIGKLNSLCGESLRFRSLHLQFCENERLSDARIEHLADSLQNLTINHCNDLVLEEDGDDGMMMPWKALHTLIRLELIYLPKMVKVPKGFQHLTSLQSLVISNCENLEALPEWLDSLTSLQHLELYGCPNIKSLPEAINRLPSLTRLKISSCGESLTKRCMEPDGEDIPKIRHIPRLFIKR